VNDPLLDFYQLPDIAKYEDFHLMTLGEQCDVWEEKLRKIMLRLSPKDRIVFEEYLNMRNDLEVATIRAAIRWGKACRDYSKPLWK